MRNYNDTLSRSLPLGVVFFLIFVNTFFYSMKLASQTFKNKFSFN